MVFALSAGLWLILLLVAFLLESRYHIPYTISLVMMMLIAFCALPVLVMATEISHKIRIRRRQRRRER